MARKPHHAPLEGLKRENTLSRRMETLAKQESRGSFHYLSMCSSLAGPKITVGDGYISALKGIFHSSFADFSVCITEQIATTPYYYTTDATEQNLSEEMGISQSCKII